MENTENTFITLGGLRRFLENLNVDMNNQMLYINQQDDNILQTAKQYSDSQDAINLATARGYTNDQDNLTLSSAKNYTDSKVGSAINTASNDATTKSNAVQNNLNTHIANITDAHDMANRLQALKVAMQAYTDQGISKVVGGAPEMLDTLYELSKAIGDNANFSDTILDSIGQKLNTSEVVNTPVINKILRLDANAQYPPIVIAQDANNRFFTDVERTKLAGIATGANLYVHPVNHLPSIITQDANNRFFTDVERTKLAGIATGANLYVHPTNHPPSIITQDTNNRFVTDAQISKWDSGQGGAKDYTDSKIAEVYAKEPVGSAGQVYYIKNDNSSEVLLSQILVSGRFVETTAELNEELSKTISFSTIFNTWERFRVIGNAGEENSWTYNAATDKVVCTINSVGYIGFVSLDKYDNYAHSVTLSSTGSDDDMIGVVIAYHKDPISGKVYTLSAIRVTNVDQGHTKIAGVGTRWALVYNYCDSDAKIIANGDSKMTGGIAMWNTITNGTAVSIKREGDKITAITSQMNSTALDSNSKLEINLNSDPLLAVFRGPKQYGYSCLSQPNSTFSNVSFSDVSSMIFDITGNKVYTFKNGAWSVDGTKSIISEIGPGRFLSNPTTGKLFFIKDKDHILAVTTKIPLANNLTTTAAGTALDASQGKLLNDKITTHKGSKGVAEHGLGDGTSAGFSTNDYTSTEKSKLSGIAAGATNYTHPVNHPASIITQDASNRFFTDAERTKLAGIATGATNYTHPATHPVSILTGVLPISNGGTGVSSKDGIVQLLYNSGDKNSIAIGSLYMMAFETNGANCGYLSLPALKTKLQWSTAELQAALSALPNI